MKGYVKILGTISGNMDFTSWNCRYVSLARVDELEVLPAKEWYNNQTEEFRMCSYTMNPGENYYHALEELHAELNGLLAGASACPANAEHGLCDFIREPPPGGERQAVLAACPIFESHLFPLYVFVLEKGHDGRTNTWAVVHPSEGERMERILAGTDDPLYDLVHELRYNPALQLGTDVASARDHFSIGKRPRIDGGGGE